MNMDACLPGYVAAEATAATKVEIRRRNGRKEREREEERERRKKAKEWATRENGRWREEDEKCNYDFEKWARLLSREGKRE